MHHLQPITITPEQIIAATQKIVDHSDDAWEYTEEQWLQAVEHYLRCLVTDVLADADWHANKDLFDIQKAAQMQPSFVEEVSELIIPAAPAGERATIE